MNGLSPATYSVHGVTAISTMSAPTIEQQHTDRDRVDRLGQVALRVLGLRGGGAHELDADEGEHRDLESGDEAHEPVREHAALVPEVSRMLAVPASCWKPVKIITRPVMMSATIATILISANQNSISPNAATVGRFQGEQDDDDEDAGDPQRDAGDESIRVPAIAITSATPVTTQQNQYGPSGEEPRPRAEQIAREVAERLVLQVRQQQLAMALMTKNSMNPMIM